MKKILLSIVVAALAMTSCSTDETTSVNRGAGIGFRAATGTRAAETTTANLANFFVTALDKNAEAYFSAAEFRREGTSNTFFSSPAYFWPADGSALDFTAYSPSATELNAAVSIDATAQTIADFSPAAAISGQKDLVVATASGSKADEGTGVALTFSHALTQIEVKAKNANTGYVYRIAGVRIGKPVSKGTYDLMANAWTLAADKANYQVEYATAKTLTSEAASVMEQANDNAMLLPQ